MVKLSFRIFDNYKQSSKMESHGGDLKNSIRELNSICQRKYGFDIRDALSDTQRPARIRNRKRADPVEMFYDKPEAVKRVRRRMGEI